MLWMRQRGVRHHSAILPVDLGRLEGRETHCMLLLRAAMDEEFFSTPEVHGHQGRVSRLHRLPMLGQLHQVLLFVLLKPGLQVVRHWMLQMLLSIPNNSISYIQVIRRGSCRRVGWRSKNSLLVLLLLVAAVLLGALLQWFNSGIQADTHRVRVQTK